jgi:uncharacterized protein (TIGR01777 family)
MRVAITGSSGFLGSALTRHLEAGGHEALRVRRGEPADPAAHWQPASGWFRESALEGVDGVVHLSGASIAGKRWSRARRELLWQSRVDSTRTLVEHLATLERKPAVLVSGSATGFYGDGGDSELSEEAPRGDGFLAELCEAWEAEAQKAEELGVRVVRARTGVVVESPEFLDRLAKVFRLGLGATLGDGSQWMPWVGLVDQLAAVERALTDEQLAGPVNIVAPPVTNHDFTKALGSAVGRPAFMRLPGFVLRLQFGRGLAEEALLVSQRAVPGRLDAIGFAHSQPSIKGALQAAVGRGVAAA